MKIIIAYFTLTGNTKKIAHAIYEEALSLGHQAALKNAADITQDTFNEFDLVFLGASCHDADLTEPVKLILEEIADSPSFQMAGYATHATPMPEGGKRNQEMYERWAGRCAQTFERISRQKRYNLLGYFHCQGAPSPPIEEFIHNEIMPDKDEWEEYIDEVRQHPNEEDMKGAKIFTLEVISQFEGGDA